MRAAVALQMFRLTGNAVEKQKAVELLEKCLGHWQRVSGITDRHYQAVPYIDHAGRGNAHKDAEFFSWSKYLPQVRRDIVIAAGATVK